MSALEHREQAQLGLQYIEDAVVALLVDHPDGLTPARIADALGLGENLPPSQRVLIPSGILELLVRSGRILWDGKTGRYLDNPDRH